MNALKKKKEKRRKGKKKRKEKDSYLYNIQDTAEYGYKRDKWSDMLRMDPC
jgi:hypothetical protein